MLAVVGGNGLYKMKKDSADGRLLIWKLSATMIAEKPMGYGYGLFEKNYNLRQADYFANEKHTDTEERNADFVYMPYNDYLEQGVEGGIPGMFFLIMFYFIIIRAAIRQRQREATAVLCAFAVMSMFNFVYTSIAPWMLLICYLSMVTSNQKSRVKKVLLPRYAIAVLLLPVAFVSWSVLGMTEAQLQLRHLDDGNKGIHFTDDKEYARIQPSASTSEAFWTSRAIGSMKTKNYPSALGYIHKARLYSSSPRLFLLESYCHHITGDATAAMASIDTLSNMIPQKFDKQQFIKKLK